MARRFSLRETFLSGKPEAGMASRILNGNYRTSTTLTLEVTKADKLLRRIQVPTVLTCGQRCAIRAAKIDSFPTFPSIITL
jgi:hypothetical protein